MHRLNDAEHVHVVTYVGQTSSSYLNIREMPLPYPLNKPQLILGQHNFFIIVLIIYGAQALLGVCLC